MLVVDDNAANRSLVCRLLDSWGCRREEATDGNSALAILRQAARGADPFQIALMDMSLPGMSGEELGRRIAADPQLKPTVLVLMTGFGRRRQSDCAHLEALGFAGHVSKPIWDHSLREVLLSLDPKLRPTAPPAATAARPQPHLVRGNSRARILVVEDNLTNQVVAMAMLNKLGYQADLAANGLEALQALRKSDYGLVLTLHVFGLLGGGDLSTVAADFGHPVARFLAAVDAGGAEEDDRVLDLLAPKRDSGSLQLGTVCAKFCRQDC